MKATRTRAAAGAGAGAKTLIVVAALAVLSGCSSGAPPAPEVTVPPSQPTTTKLYTDSDLVSILNTANTTLRAGGTVTDLGAVDAHVATKTNDVFQQVIEMGGTFTPSACGIQFTKVGNDIDTLGDNTSAFAAKLDYEPSILTVTSSTKSVDVANLTKKVSDDFDGLVTKCSSADAMVDVDGTNVDAHFSFAKVPASSHATTTYAYTEGALVDGKDISSVAVIGLDGNLLIGFEGLDPNISVSNGVTAINAVVDAAG